MSAMRSRWSPSRRNSPARCCTTCPCRSTPPGMWAARRICSSRRATSWTWPPSCASCRPEVAVLWIGLGSNLLVRDGGMRGAVVCTHGALGRARALERHAHPRRGRRAVRAHRPAMREVGLGPAEFLRRHSRAPGRRARDERRRLGRRDLAPRGRVEVLDRRGARRTRTPGRLRDRLSPRARTRRRVVHRRAARVRAQAGHVNTEAIANCSRSARRRSPSASGAAARCSPIRRAITRRG
jgi:hypothetical protein